MAVEGCRSRSTSITLTVFSGNPVSWIQSSEEPPTGSHEDAQASTHVRTSL